MSFRIACADLGYDPIPTEQVNCNRDGGEWDFMQSTCRCPISMIWNWTEAKCTFNKSANSNQSNEATPSAINLGQQCQETTDKALTDCNFEGNSEVQGVMGLAGQLKGTFDQMVLANPNLACSKLAQLSGAASAASGTFNGVCSMSYQRCQSACSQDLEDARAVFNEAAISQIRANQRRCGALANTLQNSVNNIAQFANVGQSMSYCQKNTGDAWTQHCLESPTDPMCATASQKAVDCSNPTFAASNVTCICSKNPSDPRCGNTNTAFRQNGNGGADGSDGLGDFGNIKPDFGGGTGGIEPGLPNKPLDGNLSRGGGGRSGVGVSGGGSGSGGGSRAGSGGGSGLNTKIVNGYGYGGKGGGAFGSGAGSGGGVGRGSGQYAMNNPKANAVDLKQFLPGGQRDPSRGIAGVSGPDGLTGPNTDIWKKINSRYFSISTSLLP